MQTSKSVIKFKTSDENLRKEDKSKGKKRVFSLLIGCLIGFINGFFGGGGGMICVPFFENFLKVEKKKAHATAIAVIFPLSLVSSFVYVFNGVISSQILLTVGIGVLLGGIFGAFLLKFLPTKIVGFIFAILMIISGVKLII